MLYKYDLCKLNLYIIFSYIRIKNVDGATHFFSRKRKWYDRGLLLTKEVCPRECHCLTILIRIRTSRMSTRGSLDAEHFFSHFAPFLSTRWWKKSRQVTSTRKETSRSKWLRCHPACDIISTLIRYYCQLTIMKIQWCVASRRRQFVKSIITNPELSQLSVLWKNISQR